MLKQNKRFLPILAVVGAVITIVCFSLLSIWREAGLVDTGQTGRAVEATLARLQAKQPASLEDAAFRQAVAEAVKASYIATIWLLAPNGQVIYSSGSTAFKENVTERATVETRRILATLPEDALTPEQKMWLMAASAMQAEGEHNDIYRHILRPVKGPDGAVIGLIGAAYNVSDWPAAPGAGWIIGLFSGLAGFGLYWLTLPLWVLLDARERDERAWVWAVFVFIGNLVALIAYILTRTPRLVDRQAA